MILSGNNIQTAGDHLMQTKVESIYEMIKHPLPQFNARINQLRIIHDIDPKLYVKSKKQLPYIVCGIFNPLVRKTENFAYIEYFIADIDNLSEFGISLKSLRDTIVRDARVVMLFASPSRDGLKVMFKLKERCYDHGLFSTFYKEFVKKFAIQYNIENAIDLRTSDVCRACFISADADAYYNNNAEAVFIDEYIDTSNPSALFDMKANNEVAEKETAKELKLTDVDAYDKEPEDEALNKIKDILLKRKQDKEAQKNQDVYVPEILEQYIGGIKGYLEDNGVEVYETINIQYGKKIKCKLGNKLAELNIFHGKRGFSVVPSPKNGVSKELNSVLAELVNAFLEDNS